MVDGRGEIIIPAKEIPEVQNQECSHPIVGESFTEFIDHDEEDAQRVTKATLTNRETILDTLLTSPHLHARTGSWTEVHHPCNNFLVPFRTRIVNFVTFIALC